MKYRGNNPIYLCTSISIALLTFTLAAIFGCSTGQHNATYTKIFLTSTPSLVYTKTYPPELQTPVGNKIIVVGHIVTIGNEPFTQWAVETTDNKVFGLTNLNEDRLREFGIDAGTLQGAMLEFKGILIGRTGPSYGTEESIYVIEVRIVNK